MQSSGEPNARDSWIDLGSVKNGLANRLKALIRSVIDYGSMAYDSAAAKTKEKLDRLQGHVLRICCGSLPEIQSVAAGGMRSTSVQLSTSTSAVNLRCQDPERQRSPDGKHHEELLADTTTPHTSRIENRYAYKLRMSSTPSTSRRTSSTTENSVVDPAATSSGVSSHKSEDDLPTDR